MEELKNDLQGFLSGGEPAINERSKYEPVTWKDPFLDDVMQHAIALPSFLFQISSNHHDDDNTI